MKTIIKCPKNNKNKGRKSCNRCHHKIECITNKTIKPPKPYQFTGTWKHPLRDKKNQRTADRLKQQYIKQYTTINPFIKINPTKIENWLKD